MSTSCLPNVHHFQGFGRTQRNAAPLPSPECTLRSSSGIRLVPHSRHHRSLSTYSYVSACTVARERPHMEKHTSSLDFLKSRSCGCLRVTLWHQLITQGLAEPSGTHPTTGCWSTTSTNRAQHTREEQRRGTTIQRARFRHTSQRP